MSSTANLGLPQTTTSAQVPDEYDEYDGPAANDAAHQFHLNTQFSNPSPVSVAESFGSTGYPEGSEIVGFHQANPSDYRFFYEPSTPSPVTSPVSRPIKDLQATHELAGNDAVPIIRGSGAHDSDSPTESPLPGLPAPRTSHRERGWARMQRIVTKQKKCYGLFLLAEG
jgi:hypothetical protein